MLPMTNLCLLAKPIWLMAGLWDIVLGHCQSPNGPSCHTLEPVSRILPQFPLLLLLQILLRPVSLLFSAFSCFHTHRQNHWITCLHSYLISCLLFNLFARLPPFITLLVLSGWNIHLLACKPYLCSNTPYKMLTGRNVYLVDRLVRPE